MLRPSPGVLSSINTAGRSVIAANANILGGYIVNPQQAIDQGLPSVEVLFVDATGPAALAESVTTIAIQPGQAYRIPANQTTPVWVNSNSAGHQFTVVAYLPPVQYPPIDTSGLFPPSGPTSQTSLIPSYLYKEYDDDDDLQNFVQAFNGLAQNYIDTFNALNLPVYQLQSGALLDWVAAGLYGMTRPALSSGLPLTLGPFNTYEFNTLDLNANFIIEPDVVATSDDIYKRILTWHILKGDGKVFNVRWLKRRIMRFLMGTNGSNPRVDQTYQISVTFGPSGEIDIRLIDEIAEVVQGQIFNTAEFNTLLLNELDTEVTPIAPLPNGVIFKEAMDSGVLEMPFQFSTINVTDAVGI
jgi:hypothetical protein